MRKLLGSRGELRFYWRRKNQCVLPFLPSVMILTIVLAFLVLGSVNALLFPYYHSSLHFKSPMSAMHFPLECDKHDRSEGRIRRHFRSPFFKLMAVSKLEGQAQAVSSVASIHGTATLQNNALPENIKESQSHSASNSSWSGSSSEQLQQLKDSVDIVSVIESYQLDGFKRNGDRATAICPFHNDHNPSLSIVSFRQIYKCFACGAGGDVFRFVQEYSKLPGQEQELSFGMAVRHISTNFVDGSIVLRSKPCRSGIVYLSDPGSDESEKEESRAKQSETRDENWECASASTFGGPSVSGFESNEEEDWEPADGMDVVPDAELQGDGEDGSDSGESFGKNMGYGSESASGKESEGEDFKGFCIEDSGFSDESSDELDSNFGD